LTKMAGAEIGAWAWPLAAASAEHRFLRLYRICFGCMECELMARGTAHCEQRLG